MRKSNTSKYHNIRKSARKKHLRDLLEEQNNTCFHCLEEIAAAWQFHENQIIDIKYDEQKILVSIPHRGNAWIKLATIDHLVCLANGGTNNYRNLVASCFNCNNERSASRCDLPMKKPSGRKFGTKLGPLLAAAGFSL